MCELEREAYIGRALWQRKGQILFLQAVFLPVEKGDDYTETSVVLAVWLCARELSGRAFTSLWMRKLEENNKVIVMQTGRLKADRCLWTWQTLAIQSFAENMQLGRLWCVLVGAGICKPLSYLHLVWAKKLLLWTFSLLLKGDNNTLQRCFKDWL